MHCIYGYIKARSKSQSLGLCLDSVKLSSFETKENSGSELSAGLLVVITRWLRNTFDTLKSCSYFCALLNKEPHNSKRHNLWFRNALISNQFREKRTLCVEVLDNELAPVQPGLKKPNTFLGENNPILSVCLLGVHKGMSTLVEMR